MNPAPTRSERDRADFWKPIALLLAGGLVGNLTAMAVSLDESDVRRITKEAAPYLADKASLDLRIKTNDEARTEFRADIKALRLEMAKINAKLDLALSQRRETEDR